MHPQPVYLTEVWLQNHAQSGQRESQLGSPVVLQGDGAWAPKSGERNTPVVAHGTHQNQYTKRKALLGSANQADDSNEAEEDEADDSDSDKAEGGMADHCADTGFAAAEPANSKKGMQSSKDTTVAKGQGQGQDRPASSQAGAKPSGDTQQPNESGVGRDATSNQRDADAVPDAQPQRLTRTGRKGSSGLANGFSKDQPASKRRQSSAKGRIVENAEHSSSDATPMDTSEPEPISGTDDVTAAAHPKWQAKSKSDYDAEAAPEPNAIQDSDLAQPVTLAPTSSSERNVTVCDKALDEAKDQSAMLEPALDEPHLSSASGAAAGASDEPTSGSVQPEKASHSSKADAGNGSADKQHDSDKAHDLDEGHKGGFRKGHKGLAAAKVAKAVSAAEETLQCEENLAEDASASPGELTAQCIGWFFYGSHTTPRRCSHQSEAVTTSLLLVQHRCPYCVCNIAVCVACAASLSVLRV